MIEGFAIGHRTADEVGWLTGTTVVLAGPGGAVGSAVVAGGAPGTRETDLLDPTARVDRVHAVVLTGGSAYGLAAADGVMEMLEQRGIGLPLGGGLVVPIVPAAVIFDLGRGSDLRHRPGPEFGRAAVAAASSQAPATGCVGAGTGAVCGGLKGGFGYAEQVLEGVSVAAAVVVNAAGSAVHERTGRLWADLSGSLGLPLAGEREALTAARDRAAAPLNTTLGVVLSDAMLTKAEAHRVAAVAHDGMARAIRPLHSMFDGDTAFCLASGLRPAPAPGFPALLALNALLAAAADVVTAACLNAILSADSRGPWPSYADLAPSALAAR